MPKPIATITSSYDRALLEECLAPVAERLDLRFVGVGRTLTRSELIPAIADATVVVAAEERYDDAVFAKAPLLRLLARDGVGYDSIDLTSATRHGVAVVNAPVVHESVADLAIGLAIAARRRIGRADRAARSGGWTGRDRLLGDDVFGSTVGIVGFGRLGRSIARRLSGFDVTRLVYNRTRRPEVETELNCIAVELEELLSRSDVVIIAVALSADTTHLLDARHLAMMKPGSTLVNVGRGAVVDESALVEALLRGAPATAGLDVLEQEPPSPTNPLLAMDSVVLSPHVGSDTRGSFRRVAQSLSRAITLFLAGEHPDNLLNSDVLSSADGD